MNDATFPAQLAELRRLYDTGCLDMIEIADLLGLGLADAARMIGVNVDDMLFDGSRVPVLCDLEGPCATAVERAFHQGYLRGVRHIGHCRHYGADSVPPLSRRGYGAAARARSVAASSARPRASRRTA